MDASAAVSDYPEGDFQDRGCRVGQDAAGFSQAAEPGFGRPGRSERRTRQTWRTASRAAAGRLTPDVSGLAAVPGRRSGGFEHFAEVPFEELPLRPVGAPVGHGDNLPGPGVEAVTVAEVCP